MEDTLGGVSDTLGEMGSFVLILVLMEDTLGEVKTFESFISEVLIIIRPTNSAFVNTN